MPFEDNARLDPSQVEDRREGASGGGFGGGFGGGGFGGGGFGGGGYGGGVPHVAVGGGGLGLIALFVIAMLFGVDPGSLLGGSQAGPAVSTQYGSPSGSTSTSSGSLAAECQSGADANTRDDCRALGYINSIQAYWSQYFSSQGSTYTPAKTVLYSGSTEGACGYATAATGPFYCPVDGKVYVDLSFFTDMRSQLGVNGTNFAEGYVLAHEYGHHVQDLLGALSNSQSTGATGGSVRTELQADCLAGVWANHAASTGFLTPVTNQEIQQGLDAAAAVGDDRLQQQSRGRVTPDSFTHGTSAQRQHWFQVGVQSGNLQSCDTSGKL